jgi:hypothetical protein
MKTRFASLTILLLAWAVVPAFADYDNGPINGTTDAWAINFGYIVSDSFVQNYLRVSGFEFGVWEFPGDTVTSVEWSITSGENSGTVFGSGWTNSLVDQFISTNKYGYDIDRITVFGLFVDVTAGTTYWLNLQNATVPSGNPVYWDENSGAGCHSAGCPSQASESAIGTIPSESFTIDGHETGTTPEPGSFLLVLSGILGLAGVLRRKLL